FFSHAGASSGMNGETKRSGGQAERDQPVRRLVFQHGSTAVVQTDAIGTDKQYRTGGEGDVTGALLADITTLFLPVRLQRFGNGFITQRAVTQWIGDGSGITIQANGAGADQQYHALVKMHQRYLAALRQVARFLSSDNHVCHARQYTREH